MEKKLLINDTYQVLDKDEVLFKGTSNECDNYIDVIVFLNGLKKDPEFTRRLSNFVEKITGL
jgi:hypothetical protein